MEKIECQTKLIDRSKKLFVGLSFWASFPLCIQTVHILDAETSTFPSITDSKYYVVNIFHMLARDVDVAKRRC